MSKDIDFDQGMDDPINEIIDKGKFFLDLNGDITPISPFCTLCENPVKERIHDPINGVEIQQCDSCAESQAERAIEKHWG